MLKENSLHDGEEEVLSDGGRVRVRQSETCEARNCGLEEKTSFTSLKCDVAL